MTDNLRQVGKYIGKTGRDADRALKRAYPIQPRLERIRDIFDNVNAFEMSFETTEHDERVVLDLFFRLPPPSRGCTAGCIHTLCEGFSGIVAGENNLTVSHPYVPGSVSVFAPDRLSDGLVDEINPTGGEVGFFLAGSDSEFCVDVPGTGEDGGALTPGPIGGTWTEVESSLATALSGGVGTFTIGDVLNGSSVWALDDIIAGISFPWLVESTWQLPSISTTAGDPPFYPEATSIEVSMSVNDSGGGASIGGIHQTAFDGIGVNVGEVFLTTPADPFPGISQGTQGTGPMGMTLSVRSLAGSQEARVVLNGNDSGWISDVHSGGDITDLTVRVIMVRNDSGEVPPGTSVVMTSLTISYSPEGCVPGEVGDSAIICYTYLDCEEEGGEV